MTNSIRDSRLRMFFLILSIAVLVMGGITWAFVRQMKIGIETRIRLTEQDFVEHLKWEFESTLETYISDAIILDRLIERDIINQAEEDEYLSEVVQEFSAFANNRRIYDQIRYLDSDGFESVRVNWNPETGAQVVPPEQLQNKNDRLYFIRGFHKPDKVYISRFDLNVENGSVQQPIKPVIRITYPVSDPAGGLTGLVVLNLLGQNLLAQISRIDEGSMGNVYLVNHQGDWLKGPAPEYEWLFMYDNQVESSMATEFPDEWMRILSEETGQFLSRTGLFTFNTIAPDGWSEGKGIGKTSVENEEAWRFISVIPRKTLLWQWLGQALVLALISVIIVPVLSWVLANILVQRYRSIRLLAENETKFRAIFDQTFQFIGLMSPDGTLMEVNQTALDIGGHSIEFLRGKKLWDAPWWSDSIESIRQIKESISRAKAGEFVRSEVDIVREDGQVVTLDFSVKPVHNDEDEVVLLIPEGRDITERKETERALATSESQLKTFIRNTPAAVAMFDRDMRYVEASNRWYEDYKIQGKNIIGLCHYEVFPEIENMEEWKHIHQRCLSGEVIRNDEDSFPRVDGSTDWLRWEVRPWKDGDGSIGGLMIFTESINDLVEAKNKVQNLNIELEERVAQRTSDLEEAISIIKKKERLSQLLKAVAGTANSAESMDEALEATVSLICEYLDWSVGHVYSPSDTNPNLLVSAPIWHLSDPIRFKSFKDLSEITHFREGEGLPGLVLASHSLHWIEDVTNEDYFVRSKQIDDIGLKGAFAFSVESKGNVAAVLEFFTTETKTPDKSIIEMANEVSRQLAYVIDRKRIEEAVRESERKFRGIFNQVFQQIALLSPDGRMVQVNVPALQVADVTSEELVGKFFWEGPWWKGVDGLADKIREYVRKVLLGEFIRDELITFDARGLPRNLDFSLKPIMDDNGTVLYLIAEGRDLTELKDAEMEVRKLAMVAQNTSSSVMITDSVGRVEWVNDTYIKQTGFSLEETSGRMLGDLLELMVSDEEAKQNIRTAFKEGRSVQELIQHPDRNGRLGWTEMNVQPVYREDGKLENFILTGKDITENKAANEALEQFKITLDQTHDAVAFFDLDTLKYTYVNQGVTDQLGYTEEELLLLSPVDIKPEYTRDSFLELLEPLVSGELDGLSFETIHRDKNGREFPVDIRLQFIRPADESPRFISIVRDITEQKQFNKELELAKDAAEQASVAKSQFLANMSHEIRTPMNAILGMAHLLSRKDLPQAQSEYVAKIQTAALSLLGIINDILDYSKIESGRMTIESVKFNLDSILSYISDIVAHGAQEKGLELVFHTSSTVPSHIIGDPLRLQQILLNLINNAVKFTHEGEVVVSVTDHDIGAERLVLKFSVQDTGIGISEEQLEELFLPFSQTDASTSRNYGGTGLGLAISRDLANMMGGSIQVQSNIKGGSLFTLQLPFDRGEEENSVVASPDLYGLKVLIVDDNETFLALTAEMLEGFMFDVSKALNGDEAISILAEAKKKNEPYEVVLMDWKMPGADGLETSRIIKNDQELRDITTIIMVTAYSRDDIVRRAALVGIDGILVKPITRSDLYDTIVERVTGSASTGKNSGKNKRALSEFAARKSLSGHHVLVVEDNALNQDVARELLESVGVVVTVVEDGDKAVEAVEQNQFSAVLMDIQMPGKDGYQATREIRSRETGGQHVPIIAMTANVMENDRKHAREVGVDDQVDKPIIPSVLYSVLTRWIVPDGERSNSPQTPHKAAYDTIRGLKKLPGLDIEDGLTRTEGNVGMYCRLLNRFADDQADVFERISDACAAKDFETAERLIHTLKGLSATIGALELNSAVVELEDGLFSGKLDAGNLDLDTPRSSLKETLDAILTVQKAGSDTITENKSGLKDLDLEALTVSLSALESSLQKNDSDAHRILGDLMELTGSRQNDEVFGRLKSAIGRYDYSLALECLSEVKNSLDILQK